MGRSWMAALALVAGSLAPAFADDPKPSASAPAAPDADRATSSASGQKVYLGLEIMGLGKQGCDVEIKPAHAGCSFRPTVGHVGADGKQLVVLDGVQSRSADRDCTFAITIREPGESPRTTYRGFQLKPNATTAARPWQLFLSSPSKIARAEKSGTTKR